MAVQGIWSGTISFSLVAIPVRLVTAVEPGRVSFRLLHNKDYSPLARRMFCPEEETKVPGMRSSGDTKSRLINTC